MTRLTFYRGGGHYLGFCCGGHSGYAESGGDIVCAAVSAATQFAAAYLTEYFPDIAAYTADGENAEIELSLSHSFDEGDKIIAVLESFAKSLRQKYPENFNFDYTEV